MSAERSKVLETAQKHLSKGHYDKAIAEYLKLVKRDPTDVRTWLKIGDLYHKKGARREACETYAKVAAHYADQGFFLKAVAVYRRILELDNTRLDIYRKLAEAYEHLQLLSDALKTYEHVAAAYARAGDLDEALQTLSQMCELDPENIPVRIKYAEALSRASKTKEAASSFETGAALLKQQGRIDDYVKVAERLLFHRPDDVEVAKELAQIYLDRNDPKRALAKLQLCFKANPKDVSTLSLLALAFQILDQIPKTISVYREIARLHREAGQKDEYVDVLRKILALDPSDAESRAAVEQMEGPKPPPRPRAASVEEPPPSAVVESNPPPELEEYEAAELTDDSAEIVPDDEVLEVSDDSDVLILPDDDEGEEVVPTMTRPGVSEDSARITDAVRAGRSNAGPPPLISTKVGMGDPPAEPRPDPVVSLDRPKSDPPGAKRPTSIPPDIAREAHIARLMTECEVFLRYGLKSKVIDQLHRVLELEPKHVEAREQLKDVLIEQGKTSAAIEQLVALTDLFEEDTPGVAALYLRQAIELGGSGYEPRLRGLEALSPAKSRRSGAAEEDDDLSVEEDSSGEVLFLEESTGGDMVPVPPAPSSDQKDPPPPPAAMLRSPTPDNDRVIPPPPRTDGFRSSGTPAFGESEPEDLLTPMSPQEFEAAPLQQAPEDKAAAEARAASPGEIEEVLEEAEFFMSQGVWDEATQTIEDALSSHPGHPLLLDKLEEIKELAANAPRPDPAPSVPAGPTDENVDMDVDESFLLAEKLAEEFGPAEAAPQADDDSDLLDVEAVFAQFKKGVKATVAADDTDTHFDLGIAYKEMGLLDDAVAEFELALKVPNKECVAHTMIGMCFLEKQDIPSAINHFKRGLYAVEKSELEELGLYFEIGNAYDLMGDPKEALYYLEKVAKKDPGFRGVEKRIEQLRNPASAAPASPFADDGGARDLDAAFDDLISDND